MTASGRILDFELSLCSAPGGAGHEVLLRASGEQEPRVVAPVGTISPQAVERGWLRQLHAYVERPVPAALLERAGAEMAAWLLPPAVRDSLAGALAGAPPAGLRLRLTFETPALAGLPWEYVHVPSPLSGGGDGFLSLAGRVHLVRQVVPPRTVEPVPVDRLRVLVAWADPASPRYASLPHLQREVAGLTAVLRAPECRATVTELRHATPAGLRRCLQDERPHVLHLIGHGDLRPSGGVLVLQGDRPGAEALLHGDELARWLPAESVRLVVLSACLTGAPAHGVAASLAGAGVPAVLAMQLPLRDGTAGLLARAFYAALAVPLPVEEALHQARQAVRGAGPDWGVPVLYLAAADGALFQAATARPPAPPTNLPYLPNPHFLGREEAMRELDEALRAPRPVPVALVGMAGQGKTQLAVEYAHASDARFPGGIFWLNARDTQRLTEDYAGLGRFFGVPDDLPTPERAVRVRDRLRHLADPSLLIIDNLAPGTELAVPTGGLCRILVTTRDRYLVRQGYRLLEVSALPEEAACRLLQVHRKADGAAEEDAVRRIAADLGCLPLALALTANQVERLGVPFADYGGRLARNRVEVLEQARRRFVTATGHSGSVWDAIDLSYRSLTEPVASALSTAACFAGRGISPDMLFAASGAPSRDLFDEALAELWDCCLATREQDGRLTLHELVRVYTRGQLGPERMAATLREVAAVLAHALSGANEAMEWSAVRRELAHCRSAVALCREHGIREALHPLLRQLGIYAFHHADFAAAVTQLEEALRLAEELHGRRHLEVALLLQQLGEVCQSTEQPERALACALEAAELAQTLLDDADPGRADFYNSLGYVLKWQGEHEPALARYQQALAIIEAAYGRAHPLVASCLNNIGTLREAQGDPAAALGHFREALALDQAAYGPRHVKAAIRHNNIGRVLARQERWADALAHHAEAARLHEATYGRANRDVAYSLYYQAEVERRLELRAAARLHYEEALSTMEALYGAGHRLVAAIRGGLNSLEKEASDLADNAT